jgi:hypothetical protein
MRGRALLVVGLAVGYVLGARAGRERYEQIRSGAQKLWGDPRVQRQVKQAENFAKDKAPEVVDFVSDSVKKVANQVAPKRTTTPAKRTTASKASTAKPATEK